MDGALLLDLISFHLKNNYLGQFLIVHYVPTSIDLKSAPKKLLKAIELLFIKTHVEETHIEIEKSYGYRTWPSTDCIKIQTRLFELLHSANDEPSVKIVNVKKQLTYLMQWHFLDELHRDGDKPAQIEDNFHGKHLMWFKYGLLHRENDEPAHIKHPYEKTWYKNGNKHRDGDKPAYVNECLSERCKVWYRHGLIHRDNDLPAEIDESGVKWYNYGLLHRDGDKPSYIQYSSTSFTYMWHKNGLRHRDYDRPAVIIGPNYQEWYVNGNIHRDYDRPALVTADYSQWYINGCIRRINNLPTRVFSNGRKVWQHHDKKYNTITIIRDVYDNDVIN